MIVINDMKAQTNVQLTRVKAEPRDIFLHLLAIVTLYAAAISFLVLVFQLINLYVPDKLELQDYWRKDSIVSTMRWAIAALIVVYPVHIIATRFLNKAYAAKPEKRNLRIRKWLIYFTLFVAALIIIGDLVTLIYHFLEGELTLRFILKVLTVFFVTGSIFYYNFWDVRRYNE